jgi:hypothetical protein
MALRLGTIRPGGKEDFPSFANPHFSQRFVYEATKMPAKSEVASGNKRGILDSMLSAISAETRFAAAFSKPQ